MGTAPRPLVLCGTWTTDRVLADALERGLGGRSVHLLEPPPMTDANLFRRVSDWTDHHIARMDELDLEPPFLLAGYSFGGVLALEIARTFRPSPGVAYLGLLDCIRPRIRPVRLRDAIPYHLREAAFIATPEARRRYLDRELRTRLARRTPRLVLDTYARVRGRPPDDPIFEKPTTPLIRSIHRSYLNYEAEPLKVPATLYVTQSSQLRCIGDPSLYWAPFLRGGFVVRRAEGSHSTYVDEPYVSALAAMMRTDIDAVDPPAPAARAAS
jgi:acetoacetyl-CoA synthetase